MMYAVLQKITTTEYHIEYFLVEIMYTGNAFIVGTVYRSPTCNKCSASRVNYYRVSHRVFFVKIMYTGNAFIVGTVYRPPTCNIIDFNDTLSNILEQIVHHSCFIKGNYHLNLMKHDKHPPTEIFFDVTYDSYFIPVINRPTSVTMNTCTFIDNTCANQHDVRENQVHGILKTDINDHFLLFYINCRKSPSSSDDDYKLICIINEVRSTLRSKIWNGAFWIHWVTVNLIFVISWKCLKKYTRNHSPLWG